MSTPIWRSTFCGGGHKLRMLPAALTSGYRSKSVVLRPTRWHANAVAMPPGPAPITTTRPGKPAATVEGAGRNRVLCCQRIGPLASIS